VNHRIKNWKILERDKKKLYPGSSIKKKMLYYGEIVQDWEKEI